MRFTTSPSPATQASLDFTATQLQPVDTPVPVTAFNGAMAVCVPEGPVLVSKLQAMAFFSLVPASLVTTSLAALREERDALHDKNAALALAVMQLRSQIYDLGNTPCVP